ncbi:MAG TPA: hypothetical protein VFF79_03275 [Conexibacter sp.]|nr:hypothetical protein [Conexibacter sp.]
MPPPPWEPEPGMPDDRGWSRDVYRDALARKRSLDACEACGSRAWGVGDVLLLVEALDSHGRLVPGRGVEVVPVYCNHCGLLRLHVASTLLRD